MTNINKQKIFTLLAFALVGFVLMQVPFTALVGAGAHFTLFDFFAPIVGAFLGSVPGLLAVLGIQLVNWAIHGFDLNIATLLRFLPILAATFYFTKKSIWQIIIPVLAIVAFLAHPQGRAAFLFTLYWLIPIAMYFLRDRFVFARALGATFSAHAVGGALWIWAFNTPATVWLGIIMPLVWKERGLMAVGITLSFYAFKWLLTRAPVRAALHLPALQA